MTESRSRIPPYVLEALRWIATTIGLSGILIAIGFISDFAYQDRLGYKLSSTEDLAGYSLEAGRFLVSMATLVLSWLWTPTHILVLIVVAVIAALLDFGRRTFKSAPRQISGIILLVLIVVEIVILDIPTVYLRAALVHPIPRAEDSTDGLITGKLTRGIWEDEICSRLEVEEYANLRAFVPHYCSLTPIEHGDRKADRLVLNLLLTIALSIIAVRFLMQTRPTNLLLGSLLILIVMDFLMLPYSYSKTLRPTTANDVIVSWKGVQNAAKGDESASSDAESEGGTDSELPTLFYLLYKRNDEVVLLNKDANEPNIWIVPKEEVRLLQIVDEDDVYQALVRQRIGLSSP